MSKKIITIQAINLHSALTQAGIEAELEYWDGHKHIDICIPASKIYIEVDGMQHLTNPNQIARDFIRDHYSDVDGFNTLHIPNSVIEEDLNKVVSAIKKVVTKMKLTHFNEKEVSFIESTEVKEGVVCDVYEFKNDVSRDLGVVRVGKGCKTPKQLVIDGEKTIEIHKSGKGLLTVTDVEGETQVYEFPSHTNEVEVKVGEIMQWNAVEDLEFYEVCYPPYKDGRFKSCD